MHQARDSEGVLLNLALAHLGVVVYQVISIRLVCFFPLLR